jgi:hypothetical protein
MTTRISHKTKLQTSRSPIRCKVHSVAHYAMPERPRFCRQAPQKHQVSRHRTINCQLRQLSARVPVSKTAVCQGMRVLRPPALAASVPKIIITTTPLDRSHTGKVPAAKKLALIFDGFTTLHVHPKHRVSLCVWSSALPRRHTCVVG